MSGEYENNLNNKNFKPETLLVYDTHFDIEYDSFILTS